MVPTLVMGTAQEEATLDSLLLYGRLTHGMFIILYPKLRTIKRVFKYFRMTLKLFDDLLKQHSMWIFRGCHGNRPPVF